MSEAFSGPQVLIKVRVTDSVSGRALPEAEIVTSVETDGGDFRPSPFSLRNLRDGWSVMGISHRVLTAKLQTGVTTRFRFEVSLLGYASKEDILFIGPDDFQVVTEDVDVGGVLLSRSRIAGAPFEQRIMLDPLPVRLAGQLLRENDLNEPIEGATVTLDGNAGGAVVTGSNGRFLFDALPLAQTVEVEAVKGGDSAASTHITNFKQPTNQLTLSFFTEPTD